MSNTRIPFLSAVVLSALSALTFTASAVSPTAVPDPGDQDLFTLSLEQLAEITVVTATQAPQSLADSPFSVTVITADQLRNFGARTIYDALMHVPGLRVESTNRGRPVVSVRGVQRSTTDYLLFMLDGHPLNEPANGSATFLFDLSQLPVQNIERIEVVRGPGSAVYGNHAFLGMVNIITRSADQIDGTEFSFRDEFEADGNIGQAYNILHGSRLSDQATITFNANLVDRDGADIDIDPDVLGRSGKADTDFDQIDLQGLVEYRRLSVKGRYTHQERGEYAGAVSILSPKSKVEFDAAFLDARLGFDIAADTEGLVRVYGDRIWGDASIVTPGDAFAPGDPFRPTGRNSELSMDVIKLGAEAKASYRAFDGHVLTVGTQFEYQEQDNLRVVSNVVTGVAGPASPPRDVTATDPFGQDADRTWYAVFAEDSWRITDRLKLDAGLRYDNYSDFGGSINPRLGLKWAFIDDWNLRLTYGTAFRAPDFRSLFLTSPVTNGNPALEDEKVTSYEAGVAGTPLEGLRVGLTLFQNDLEDLIDVPPGGDTFENIQKVRARGVELEGRMDIGDRGYVEANYSFTDSNLDDGSPFPGVPYHSANLLVSMRLLQNLNAALAWYWQGDSPRAQGDARDDLGGFNRVDANLVYRGFGKHLELEFAVFNALNDDYADPAPQGTLLNDYPNPGRSFMFGIRYRP